MFFKELRYAIDLRAYKYLSKQYAHKSVFFVAKLLALSLFLALILFMPAIVEWPYLIALQAKHINVSLSGNMSTTEAVLFPPNEPMLVVDTSGNRPAIGTENLLLTDQFLEYKILKQPTKISYSELKTDKEKLAGLIWMGVLFIIPSILFWYYFCYLLKYAVICTLFALVAWLIIDLTAYKQGFSRIFNTAAYALIVMIPFEVIAAVYDTSWMMPLFEVIRIKFYLIPLVLYTAMFLLALIFVVEKHPEHT